MQAIGGAVMYEMGSAWIDTRWQDQSISHANKADYGYIDNSLATSADHLLVGPFVAANASNLTCTMDGYILSAEAIQSKTILCKVFCPA